MARWPKTRCLLLGEEGGKPLAQGRSESVRKKALSQEMCVAGAQRRAAV